MLQTVFDRPIYLNRLKKYQNSEFIKVITGVRRSGKTFVLEMFRRYLQTSGVAEAQIVFLNFESMQLQALRTAETLYRYVMERAQAGQKMYLFFDEIQRVAGWEDAVNSLRVDLDADIYLSGSNSSLLSGELATLLVGRMVEIPVFPLSFQEYMQFRQFDGVPDTLFPEYVQRGGFPATALVEDEEVRRTILDGIFNSILLKDVSERANLRNDGVLSRLAAFLLSETGNSISINNITNTLKNEGTGASNNAIAKYVDLLEQAFIFYQARRYDLRGKAHLRTQAKYYSVDTGLRNATLNKSFRDNFGHQIENIVFIELLRRGYQVDVGSYDNTEIDFVAKKGTEIQYFQVAMQLPENSNREVGNLVNLPDNYQKTVLTANRMDVGEVDGVKVVHVVDWLVANHM
ncbi:ATP-binding protein [Haemophilus haemolyticus]|uniref:ATP-binding protein n=1 Tax=Haemophilus haemolyticus TaxID=726 RepID=UPI000E568228|nr:ATP-binding protein [Haemophilus haemolyticus]